MTLISIWCNYCNAVGRRKSEPNVNRLRRVSLFHVIGWFLATIKWLLLSKFYLQYLFIYYLMYHIFSFLCVLCAANVYASEQK